MRVSGSCVYRNDATAYIDPENEDWLQRATEELMGQKGIYADFVLAREEAAGWKLKG